MGGRPGLIGCLSERSGGGEDKSTSVLLMGAHYLLELLILSLLTYSIYPQTWETYRQNYVGININNQ